MARSCGESHGSLGIEACQSCTGTVPRLSVGDAVQRALELGTSLGLELGISLRVQLRRESVRHLLTDHVDHLPVEPAPSCAGPGCDSLRKEFGISSGRSLTLVAQRFCTRIDRHRASGGRSGLALCCTRAACLTP